MIVLMIDLVAFIQMTTAAGSVITACPFIMLRVYIEPDIIEPICNISLIYTHVLGM